MKQAIGVVIMTIAMMVCGCSEAAAPKRENAEILAISMIAKYEGFRAKVYICAGGKKTIGYGFTDPALIAKGTITRKEADRHLGILVRKELRFLNAKISGLSERQKAACVSFIYNLGRSAFLNSTMFKRLKERNFAAAATECNRWVHCNGKVLKGLVKRRAAEARYLIG